MACVTWTDNMAVCCVIIIFSSIAIIAAINTVIREEHVLGSKVELYCGINSTNMWWECPNGKKLYENSSMADRICRFGAMLRITILQLEDEGVYRCTDDTTTEAFNVSIPALISSRNPAYFRNMKIDTMTSKLIVGSMNLITVFDVSSNHSKTETISKEILPSPTNVQNCKLSHQETPYCQNHFRILSKKAGDIYFVCGTNGDFPTGYEFNITDGTYKSTGSIPCSNNPFHNFTTVYVEDNNHDGKAYPYYGSVYYSDKTVQRPTGYNANGNVSNYMKGVDSSRWFQEPEFVGSFDVDDVVLFFFREKAIETDPTNTKIYSRVAKVCKKDVGGSTQLRNKWTSYQKTRLSCRGPGEIPVYFDIIQDVQMVDGNTFYGLFTSGTSGLSDSAICVYSLANIKSAFEGQFKHQPTSDSYWKPVDTTLNPRPGQCVGDSLTLSDDTLEFIANKPLMNNVVETQPLFVKEQENLMQLELHWNTTELVFYVASNRGKIYKLFLKDNTVYELCNYSISIEKPVVVWSLQQYGDFLYAGTDYNISRIDVYNCAQYFWIDECTRDPHCAWIDNTNILPQTEDGCSDRCQPLSFVLNNGHVNEDGIFTHNNRDISLTTPMSCPPYPPRSVRSIQASSDTIDMEWIVGGGFNQTFCLEYRHETDQSPWKSLILDSQTTMENDVFRYTLETLPYAGTCYHIRVFSMNQKGNSTCTSPIFVSTKAAEVGVVSSNNATDSKQLDTTVLVLIALLVIFFFVIVGQIVFIFKKNVNCKESCGLSPTVYPNGSANCGKGNSKMENELPKQTA